MSNTKNGIIVGIIFLTFIALFLGLYIRRREIAFEGDVIDKDVIENQVQNTSPMNRGGITFGNSGGVTHTYQIKVKTSTGKTVNYQISEGMYEIIKIGDRVSKPKGTTEVSIVSSTSGISPPNTNTSPPTPPAAQQF